MESTRWRAWGRYLAAGAGATAISLFAFVLRAQVPIFDWVDLGVHELGHMIAAGCPRMLYFLAGSLLQVAVPAALAVYFGWRQRDWAGAGFCTAWAGTSAWDVSVYIADAPVQALPLVGGGTHDWAYLLGPQGWGAVDRADSVAGFVDFLGMAAAVAGIGLAVWPAVRYAGGRLRSQPAAEAVPLGAGIREPLPGAEDDPLAAVPASAFPTEPELVHDHEADPDPWLAASRLPFFHEGSGDGSP